MFDTNRLLDRLVGLPALKCVVIVVEKRFLIFVHIKDRLLDPRDHHTTPYYLTTDETLCHKRCLRWQEHSAQVVQRWPRYSSC